MPLLRLRRTKVIQPRAAFEGELVARRLREQQEPDRRSGRPAPGQLREAEKSAATEVHAPTTSREKPISVDHAHAPGVILRAASKPSLRACADSCVPYVDRVVRELRPLVDRVVRARGHLRLERHHLVRERLRAAERVADHLLEGFLAGEPRLLRRLPGLLADCPHLHRVERHERRR